MYFCEIWDLDDNWVKRKNFQLTIPFENSLTPVHGQNVDLKSLHY